ncbi:Calponin homology domain-containing protein [Caenorhabditis elegans]|uniref:Calponin homology domain-containing protein n=1 Tax=Caenorhabditis elegans TaxID=6239 RepID=Q9XXA2_CAEEL|nr:Calponin homology domain-containing protein [Caenorhabditis elegans]CAA20332.1 Calponin homology domain-containing protein [Caenorhabditis elegans]|eukprot:NP_496438.1 microtubule End Binding Protein [Caenorhabditis elegans]
MVVNVFISAVTTDTLSRKEAVAWVNNLLKSHFTKVEEMASGAAYCQLTHLLFNAINLKKVKFNPRSEPDVLNNWKVLTTTWKDLGIDKPVDVEKMKKAKFQDNMEFLQWFYKFYNANLTTEPEEYDAVGARFGEDLPALKGSTGSRPVAAPARPVAAAPPKPRPAAPAVAAPAVKASVPPTVRNGTRPAPATSAGTRRADPSASEELLKQEIEKHKAASDEWETTAKEMETEREYYYSILQRVESLANEAEESGSSTVDVAALKTILYAGNEDTEQVDEIENEHLVESLQANLDDTETF